MTGYRACRSGQHWYNGKEFKSCPECEWISRDLWRRRNREALRDYQRRWRKKNPDKVKEYARRWRDTWGPMAWLDDRR